jgi:hypothetical protein
VDGAIIADCSNGDPVGAITGAQLQFNQWYMKKNGIPGAAQTNAPSSDRARERASPSEEGLA